ncbi:hypothetical protein APHAL10511_000216 [Amanita phalloides]|nr:hypothetical protein APHAL10511_000216 [Amanita phalloides]
MKATDKILLDKQALKAEALEDDAFFPAVVNISSSYVNTPEVNESLVKLIKDGIHVVVAAGDEDKPLPKLGRDLESIIWVGASTLGDKKWKYSNYGPGVDLFAPGEDIKSATCSSGDIYSEATQSGTAFAVPHVTGIIACLLSHPSYSALEPKMMKEKILAMAEDVVNHGEHICNGLNTMSLV